jgi:AraC family transcriptional activator of pyochelin receptor
LPAIIEAVCRGEIKELAYRVLPQPPEAAELLKAILQNPYVGTLRLLRAQAKAVDLLCISLDALNSVPEGKEGDTHRFSNRDIGRLSEARNILLAEFATPPTLPKLARRVGLNATKLSVGFKREFGETVHNFVRRLRLERASELLRTTDLLIGQVADAVGYAHHSTFTVAFTDYFGVAPRSLIAARHVYGKESGKDEERSS